MSDEVLSYEDKVNIVKSHQKNLRFNEYNLNLSLKQESSKASPSEASIIDIKAQAADVQRQITILQEELDSLEHEEQLRLQNANKVENGE